MPLFSLFAKLFSKGARQRQKIADKPAAPSRQTFHMTTENGFCIESQPGKGLVVNGDLVHTFVIYSPGGAAHWCAVHLPGEVAYEIDSYCGSDRSCEKSRFMLAICEEAIASFLMENSRLPTDGFLIVDQFTDSLKQWIDSALRRPVPLYEE